MKPVTGKQRQPRCCLVAFVLGGQNVVKSEGAIKDSYLYWMSLMQTVWGEGWVGWGVGGGNTSMD